MGEIWDFAVYFIFILGWDVSFYIGLSVGFFRVQLVFCERVLYYSVEDLHEKYGNILCSWAEFPPRVIWSYMK